MLLKSGQFKVVNPIQLSAYKMKKKIWNENSKEIENNLLSSRLIIKKLFLYKSDHKYFRLCGQMLKIFTVEVATGNPYYTANEEKKRYYSLTQPDTLALWICEAKEIFFMFSESIDLVQLMKCQYTHSLSQTFIVPVWVRQLSLRTSFWIWQVFLCFLPTPTCAYGSFDWFSPIKCA